MTDIKAPESAEKKENNIEEQPKAEPNKVSDAPLEFRIIMGKKLGMTQIFDEEGNLSAASVVKAGPCSVVNVRTDEKDGYKAVCLGFEEIEEKKLNKPLKGQFKKINLNPLRYLKEYRVEKTAGFDKGQIVSLKDRFNAGDYVDVSGVTKGKGFAGAMKRHNFGGLPASHGASDKERSPGSISSQRSLGRVIPGQKMPGHMGHRKVTVAKIEVLRIDNERNLIYLNGSVPGPNGTLVTILETTKPKKKKPVKVKKAAKGKKK